MKDYVKLLLCIASCELVGILGTPFTISAIPTWYAGLTKPFFSPPTWVFGPVWTLLYCLMGISFYLIIRHGWKKKAAQHATLLFLAQLLCNFLWTPLFFGFKSPLMGLITIVTLWILIVLTIKKSYAVSKPAAYLLIPYLLWVSFATALNAAIFILN